MHNSPSTRLRKLSRPFQIFARHQAAGAMMLLAATVTALAWANSPWSKSYFEILHLDFAVRLGAFEFSKSLSHWINDGLMGFFFFVVGLELKRELIAQIERELISARTKEALERRKAEGLPVGRPKGQAPRVLLDEKRDEIVNYLEKGSTNDPWPRSSDALRPHFILGSGGERSASESM